MVEWVSRLGPVWGTVACTLVAGIGIELLLALKRSLESGGKRMKVMGDLMFVVLAIMLGYVLWAGISGGSSGTRVVAKKKIPVSWQADF